jgi:predicted DNA-binding protein YlxM (UPF0122 family)
MSIEAPFPGENEDELPHLTELQGRRLAKHLSGLSASEIARQEGVTKQAVADTLRRPSVGKYAVRAFGRLLTYRSDINSLEVDMIAQAVHTIAHALCRARKAVTLNHRTADGEVSQRIEYVPDIPTRLAAAKLFLDTVRPAQQLYEELHLEQIDDREDVDLLFDPYPEDEGDDEETLEAGSDETTAPPQVAESKDVTPQKLAGVKKSKAPEALEEAQTVQ